MKYRILYIIFAAMLSCICIISCSKEEEIIPAEIKISEGTDIYAEATGEQITITFTANKEWTISSKDAWCAVNPSSGVAGTHKITFTIEENTTEAERVAWIVFTCEDALKNMNIRQYKYSILSIMHNNKVFKAPEFTGNGVKGKINWGDGNTEEYKSNSTHNYSTESTHTVQVKSVNAIEVKLENIQGIQELDLSKF